MSAISTPSRFAVRRKPDASVPLHDVRDRVKSWGRLGIILGANFGFVFGVILVAIPFTADVLSFGVIGTLVVSAVECAVIAGGFAALAAVLYGKGVGGGSIAQFERTVRTARRSAVAGPRDVALAEWPARLAYPVQTAVLPLVLPPDEGLDTAFSLPDIQARLNTIDAWENGNTGP